MTDDNKPQDDELCPCGSGKPYEACCKKEYDNIMATRSKLKAALDDPKKSKELMELIKKNKK